MQPHCARLVVAGRRRDRDDPRTLRARAPSSVEADARAMDHRAHVAGPPPLRQPVPVITVAPSVEGSVRTISMAPRRGQGLFKNPRRHPGSREAAIRDPHPRRASRAPRIAPGASGMTERIKLLQAPLHTLRLHATRSVRVVARALK